MASRFDEPEPLPAGRPPAALARGHRSPLPEEPSLAELLATLGGSLARRPRDGVTHHVVEPARAGRHAPWPDGIDPALREALRRRGIHEPWVHQARAMRHVLDGDDVI